MEGVFKFRNMGSVRDKAYALFAKKKKKKHTNPASMWEFCVFLDSVSPRKQEN